MGDVASSASSPARSVAVSVNGVVVPREAIAREVQQHPASSPGAAWRDAARALVIRELMLQEARRLGLKPTPHADAEGRTETDDEASIRTLIEQEIAVPDPDTEACKRYYDQNQRRFRSPDIYQVTHILVAANANDPATYRKAREKAISILAEAKQEPERFAELARVHSDCPSGTLGGNLGQITSGQTTPEFERAVKGLAPGRIGDTPTATRYGFHIIRVDRMIAGHPLPFEAIASRIADYLTESVRRRAAAQYIARLAARATVTGIELAAPDVHRVS